MPSSQCVTRMFCAELRTLNAGLTRGLLLTLFDVDVGFLPLIVESPEEAAVNWTAILAPGLSANRKLQDLISCVFLPGIVSSFLIWHTNNATLRKNHSHPRFAIISFGMNGPIALIYEFPQLKYASSALTIMRPDGNGEAWPSGWRPSIV